MSSYAEQQQDPRKHLTGLAIVIGFHIVLGYALVNGLARKVVDVLKAPLSVNVLEEIKAPPPPPPPPPKPIPQQVKTTAAPKVTPPPPAYVPPVETPVQAPAQTAVIATTSHEAPPEPAPAPPPPAPVVAPAPPPAVSVGVACPNHAEVRSQVPFPRQAERMGLSGDVLVEFIVAAGGEVKDIHVVRSSNAVFNSAATGAVAQLRCIGQGHDIRVRVPFSFQQPNG